MAVYVVDTDTLSLHQRGHPTVVASVAAHAADSVVLSVVTLDEQIRGWFTLARAAKTQHAEARASQFLVSLAESWAEFVIVPETPASLARFDQLRRAKLNVKHPDLRIAAIALELGATVVTRNHRDFSRVPGLVLEDWSV